MIGRRLGAFRLIDDALPHATAAEFLPLFSAAEAAGRTLLCPAVSSRLKEHMHRWWSNLDPETVTQLQLCLIAGLMIAIAGVLFWQTSG